MLMLSSATRNRHGCVLCEEEVLRCLFDGQSNKAIGALLFVSVDTVKTHLKRIYSKLVPIRETGELAPAGATPVHSGAVPNTRTVVQAAPRRVRTSGSLGSAADGDPDPAPVSVPGTPEHASPKEFQFRRCLASVSRFADTTEAQT
jgi:hypothetical protein